MTTTDNKVHRTDKRDHTSSLASVANKTLMIKGKLNYRNVIEMLQSTEYPTVHPTGISIPRYAAMVVNHAKN